MARFIIEPGVWLGEGKIAFSSSKEQIIFYTKWQVTKAKEGMIHCTQQIEIPVLQERSKNQLLFSEWQGDQFVVMLSNASIGSIKGSGILSAEKIAWEFRQPSGLEGFELYSRETNGDYRLHAEYHTGENYRTVMDALLWHQEELTQQLLGDEG